MRTVTTLTLVDSPPTLPARVHSLTMKLSRIQSLNGGEVVASGHTSSPYLGHQPKSERIRTPSAPCLPLPIAKLTKDGLNSCPSSGGSFCLSPTHPPGCELRGSNSHQSAEAPPMGARRHSVCPGTPTSSCLGFGTRGGRENPKLSNANANLAQTPMELQCNTERTCRMVVRAQVPHHYQNQRHSTDLLTDFRLRTPISIRSGNRNLTAGKIWTLVLAEE